MPAYIQAVGRDSAAIRGCTGGGKSANEWARPEKSAAGFHFTAAGRKRQCLAQTFEIVGKGWQETFRGQPENGVPDSAVDHPYSDGVITHPRGMGALRRRRRLIGPLGYQPAPQSEPSRTRT
jgi:hypothetical protein